MISAIYPVQSEKAGSLSNYLTNQKTEKAVTIALVDTVSQYDEKTKRESGFQTLKVTTKAMKICRNRKTCGHGTTDIKTGNSSFKDKYSDFVLRQPPELPDNGRNSSSYSKTSETTKELSRLRRWKSSTGVTK